MERLRLKEWRSFVGGDGRFFVASTLFDAKLLGYASLEILDRKTGRRHGFRRIFPGSPFSRGFARKPAQGETLYGSRRRFRIFRTGLELVSDPEAGLASLIAFTVPLHGPSLTCRLNFALGDAACAPSTICQPLGLGRSLLMSRILAPISGELVFGDERIALDEAAGTGIFEDGKAFFPWRTSLDTLAAFGADKAGRRVGFTLCDSESEGAVPGKTCNNRVFTGTESFALPGVKITHPYGPEGDWVIQDTEGMVDLVFKVESPRRFMLRMIVAELDLNEAFGKLEGFVKTPAGETLDAGRLQGYGRTRFMRI